MGRVSFAADDPEPSYEPPRDPVRHWGWTLDAGLPDMVHGGVAWRPKRGIRLTVTAATNGIGPGGRVSLALKAPWDVAPVLAVEVGGFVPSDARPLVGHIAGETVDVAVLEQVGFYWGSAHVGLEFGEPRSTFFIHGGMSEIHADIRGLQAMADAEAGEGVLTVQDPHLRVRAPSARIGFIWFFKAKERS